MHLEVLIEEASAEPVVRRVIGATPGWTSFEVRIFEGKPDLLGSLPERLRGYVNWQIDLRILVLVDRDDEECERLKDRLESIAHAAGLETRAGGTPYRVCNRIACEELEAWFLGDEAAVRGEYPRVRAFAAKAAFRDPDGVAGGTCEAFERLLQRAGYYSSGLRKVDVANRLSPRLDIGANRSTSFAHFVTGLADLLGQ